MIYNADFSRSWNNLPTKKKVKGNTRQSISFYWSRWCIILLGFIEMNILMKNFLNSCFIDIINQRLFYPLN